MTSYLRPIAVALVFVGALAFLIDHDVVTACYYTLVGIFLIILEATTWTVDD